MQMRPPAPTQEGLTRDTPPRRVLSGAGILKIKAARTLLIANMYKLGQPEKRRKRFLRSSLVNHCKLGYRN